MKGLHINRGCINGIYGFIEDSVGVLNQDHTKIHL